MFSIYLCTRYETTIYKRSFDAITVGIRTSHRLVGNRHDEDPRSSERDDYLAPIRYSQTGGALEWYDAEKTNAEAIIKSFDKFGYKATEVKAETTTEKKK